MAQTLSARYSRVAVEKMMQTIDGWMNAASTSLNVEESRDYPREERLDELNTRCDALQAAYDALEDLL